MVNTFIPNGKKSFEIITLKAKMVNKLILKFNEQLLSLAFFCSEMIGRFLKSDLEKFVKVVRSIYVLLFWSSNTKQSTTKLIYSKFQETIERLR